MDLTVIYKENQESPLLTPAIQCADSSPDPIRAGGVINFQSHAKK
jgi:hypothetical protein